MTAWFDLITRGLGETNPYDELRDYQRRAILQNAVGIDPNAAAGGIDPGIGPTGTPMGAPPGQPGGSVLASAPGTQPGAKGPVQPTAPPEEAQAYSTPKDLGSIMLDLQQYNERSQGFNQALGTGFAALSQPRDRQMVSQMFNTTPGDPTKIGETLMRLNSAQFDQDRTNSLGRLISGPQGAQLANQLNISLEELRARYLADPVAVGNMIQNFAAPPEATKNYNQGRAQMKAQGMTDEQINAIMPPEMLALGGISDPGYREFVLARRPKMGMGWACATQRSVRDARRHRP
jgi:hypothetical protein